MCGNIFASNFYLYLFISIRAFVHEPVDYSNNNLEQCTFLVVTCYHYSITFKKISFWKKSSEKIQIL